LIDISGFLSLKKHFDPDRSVRSVFDPMLTAVSTQRRCATHVARQQESVNAMIAVIFEVVPHADHTADYFNHAAHLKSTLEQMDGFISVERFESLVQPGKFLSLSFWRDEDAVKAWRNEAAHRATQSAGRNEIFADYRLRVAHVVRDYGLFEREQAPDDSKAHHR
jgi:heme-degrading monooxygenase HmoA